MRLPRRVRMLEYIAACSLASLLVYCMNRRHASSKKFYSKLSPVTGHSTNCRDDRSNSDVRILTQNMWTASFPGAEWGGSKGPRVRERFDAFLQGVVEGAYDILLLQELFIQRTGYFFATVEDVAYLVEQLERAGFKYHTGLAYNLPLLFGQSSGVAIFSKHPILEWSGHTFPNYSWKEIITAKGFVQAAIDVRGVRLNVFSTHMDSSAWEAEKRIQQAVDVSRAAAKLTAKSEPVVIAGDFNINGRASSSNGRHAYTRLIGAMKDAGLASAFTDLAATFYAGGVLDHMFIGGSGLVRKDVPSDGVVKFNTELAGLMMSDHFGLSLSISLRGSQNC